MTFAEKLDILMNITNTSNSVLARNISLDASFISRLRRGVRTPSKNVTYIQAMAEYFARNCRAGYQKTALLEAIQDSSGFQPQTSAELMDLIYEWLRAEEEADPVPAAVDEFVHGVAGFQFKKPEPVPAVAFKGKHSPSVSDDAVFYGVEGKQNAVLVFLSLALESTSPDHLLLFSDEDMGWLIGNREFTAAWSTLLAQVIRSGKRIKIIHNVNRDFDEMLSAIREWVPIYMTGTIEPYYYPKTRDGLFRRTLFIAPDAAAVSSCSVGSGSATSANFLFTDKQTIQALKKEFHDLLALCRPLMRIFAPFDKEAYARLLAEFEAEQTDAIIKTDSLASITLPLDVLEQMLARAAAPHREKLLADQQRRLDKFTAHLSDCRFTAICPFPDLESIMAGEAVVSLCEMPGETKLRYTPEEYLEHLKNNLRLLKTSENYHLYLTRDNHLKGSMVYVREDVGVLIGKTLQPAVVFAINESNMTATFWDYMKVLIKNAKINKRPTIETLESLVASLEAMRPAEK